jgi:hypothetical protein
VPDIVSKAVALQLGLKRYFTGKPCCHGHVSERRVANGHCIVCSDENQKEKRKVEPYPYPRHDARRKAKALGLTTYQGHPCREGHTERRTYDKACAVCRRLSGKDSYENRREYMKKWRDQNPEKVREYRKRSLPTKARWLKENNNRVHQYGRRSRLLYSKENSAIKSIQAEAERKIVLADAINAAMDMKAEQT